MVKITDGVSIFEVTNGAYEEIYKKQGFEPLEEALEDAVNTEPEDGLGSEAEDGLDVPLSEWSKKQLKAFADENDIDLSGTKTADEARERVREFLNK
jgi:hypothetical protein|nr:MAG TPA: HeH/LEM domain [Caudoviricetes sp.]